MESNDLPEINSQKEKEKKEKKGFLPWLRQRLGFGRSASMGELSSQGAINLGKMGAKGAFNLGKIGAKGAFSIGKFGASKPGLFALLAAKASVIAPLAIVAIAVGSVMYMRSSNNNASTENIGSMGSIPGSSRGSDYVPAILREKSTGSSLDMFAEANKGKVSSDEPEAKGNEEEANKEEGSADENAGQTPDVNEDIAQLQGVAQIGLSSEFGSGNKFSALGGFGSKLGTFGGKVEFSNIGKGFSNLPKFQDRKNKLLSMNAKKFGVNKAAGINAKKGHAKKTLGRAQAIRNTMTGYKGSNSDTLRSTADAAWEGTTGEGAAGIGGEGISNGGAGIVETPSSLNDVGATGGGAGVNDLNYPTNANYDIDNPWGNMLENMLMMLMGAALASFAGGLLVKTGKPMTQSGFWPTVIAGWALVIAGWALIIGAIIASIAVIKMSIDLMTKYGQAKLGTIYLIAGIAALAAAGLALAGAVGSTGAAALVGYFAGAAGILAMLGSMAAGSAMKDYGKGAAQCQQNGGTWDKDKGECK